jgi:hypothetical protein
LRLANNIWSISAIGASAAFADVITKARLPVG